MSDLSEALKAMTVKALRDLARKQLGAGHSKLKTKSELVAALAKAAVAKAGGRGTSLDTPARRAASGDAGRATRDQRVLESSDAGRAARDERGLRGTSLDTPARRAASGDAARATRDERVLESSDAGRAARDERALAKPLATATPKPAATAKPKAALAPIYDEHLGDLPDRYQDDTFIALPVDPTTLFLYWDFNPNTAAAAARGLPSAHTVLTVRGDGQKIREVDLALESRSFYVRGLTPGRSYQAEIDFVGSDGRRQRVGRSTNAVGAPPSGPSPVVDDRFIAFPWEWKRAGGQLASRPVPGAAQRDLAAGAARGGSSLPTPRPWLPGGALSGRPVGK